MPGVSEMAQGTPTEIFITALTSQTSAWLLNYKLYAVVGALVAISFVRPIYRWSRSMFVGVAHDYVYGVFHTILVFPFLAVFLFYVNGLVTAWFPSLRLNLYAHLPAWSQIVLAMLVNDFLGYFSHYLRHKIRPLWFFHVIHHSQPWVNPLTVKRSHFMEKFVDLGVIKAIPFIILGKSCRDLRDLLRRRRRLGLLRAQQHRYGPWALALRARLAEISPAPPLAAA